MATADPPLTGLNAVEAAEQRAFERGRESAQLKAQVQSHERRLDAINGSIDRGAKAQEHTASKLRDLTATVERTAAIALARGEDAKLAAEKQVTKREFVLGLISAVAIISGVLAQTGHV